MTLLQDLVDGAAGDMVPVATLLRQLKIVAARTDAAPLADWIRDELEGYPSAEAVPPYRGPFPVHVVGDFLGMMGSHITNVPIPPTTVPEEHRASQLFVVRFTDPVAELAQLATRPTLEAAWPADAVRAYNSMVAQGKIQRIVREDMVLATAKYGVPTSIIVGVLDAVRTRVLDLALELEKVAPAAGQPDAPSETTPAAQQVIINHFTNLTGNVAIASDQVAQAVTVQLPAPGDETALLRYLAAVGVDVEDLAALREALAQDRQDAGGDHPPAPGHRVTAWMGRASTDLGTNAVGSAIGTGIVLAIKMFFGG